MKAVCRRVIPRHSENGWGQEAVPNKMNLSRFWSSWGRRTSRQVSRSCGRSHAISITWSPRSQNCKSWIFSSTTTCSKMLEVTRNAVQAYYLQSPTQDTTLELSKSLRSCWIGWRICLRQPERALAVLSPSERSLRVESRQTNWYLNWKARILSWLHFWISWVLNATHKNEDRPNDKSRTRGRKNKSHQHRYFLMRPQARAPSRNFKKSMRINWNTSLPKSRERKRQW